jgi:hypothetical protein
VRYPSAAGSHFDGSDGVIWGKMIPVVTPRPSRCAREAGSKLDGERAREVERSLALRERMARSHEKLSALRSKKARIDRRRDELLDRDLAREIYETFRLKGDVRLAARKAPGVIVRKTPVHEVIWEEIKKQGKKLRKANPPPSRWVKRLWVPHWDHTGDRLKAFAWAAVMSKRPCLVFTLHLSEKVLDAARRHSRGFTAYLRDRIQRELRRAGSGQVGARPSFFFGVEASELGKIHLHGAIEADDGEKAHIRAALKRAGGWNGAPLSGREVHLKEAESLARWTAYLQKWSRGSERIVEGPTLAATSELRSEAKEWFSKARVTGETLRHDQLYFERDLLAIAMDEAEDPKAAT